MSSSASGPSPDPRTEPSSSASAGGTGPDDDAAGTGPATTGTSAGSAPGAVGGETRQGGVGPGADQGTAGSEATQGTTAATGTPGAEAADEPPTPQLTTKQASRINAPVRGMVISMIVLLLLLLPFIWLQPKPDAHPYRAQVDVAQEATFAKDQAPFTPAAPALGDGWSANYATWNEKSQDGVPLWSVGYLSPDYHLVEMVQTAESNPTWLAQRTELIPVTGEKKIGDVTWQLHHRDATGKQEEFTAWVATLKDSTVLLSGKAPDADFQHVAEVLSGS
ncbi:hypothetical protein KVA01_04800 [Kocuria varians]|uniref:DUF4245 domain-containing protein n=1 Tax=Kocuria varians TaxID=1272 RepID=A0A4Y4CZG1_KOCVA|nr:DUF4245 domain-containing protein [Kocuria varians]GEC98325.1 hypothetical protein KVA01_04800 [Kocuria varians]